ncbi:hypothetical protein [Micromonospora parva]|uniref:hypothetical protein n=1 Tax=Micromonospora parva TaxID=1464048 RepID=UPI0033EA6A8E
MATEALIERILAASDGPSSSTIDALHELLDDATIEASTVPRSVAEAARLVGLSTHTLRYYEQAVHQRAGARRRQDRQRRGRAARSSTKRAARPLLPVRRPHGWNDGIHGTISHDIRPRPRQARSRASLR